VVNYETRQPQISTIAESLARVESEDKATGAFVNQEYYQMMAGDQESDDNPQET
jgi:hypothetical protein